MKRFLCSVRDSKSGVWMAPFSVMSKAEAIRSFMTEVNSPDKGSFVAKYPGDFELWHVGYFDDQQGDVEHCVHESLGVGTNYLQREV